MQEKLLRNHIEQEELLTTRETLLRRLENANEELKEEKMCAERRRRDWKAEVDKQVSDSILSTLIRGKSSENHKTTTRFSTSV